MKYKCISDYWIEDVKIMSENDIIVIDKNDLFNITTGMDHRNLSNIDRIIDTILVNISDDNIPIKPSNEQQFESITNQMLQTYRDKNHDYGNSFDKSLDKFGLIASIVRMEDKMNRLENLVNKDRAVKDESLRDSLLDLANYAIMTVMWMDGK